MANIKKPIHRTAEFKVMVPEEEKELVTQVDGKVYKAANILKLDAAADAAAREAMAVDSVRSTISGQIGARMRAPGRGATLLSDGAGRANTLLTVTGG